MLAHFVEGSVEFVACGWIHEVVVPCGVDVLYGFVDFMEYGIWCKVGELAWFEPFAKVFMDLSFDCGGVKESFFDELAAI